METMMSDYDTQRIGQIQALEEKILILQHNLAEAQQKADKWAPTITTEANPNEGLLKICLRFGGKMVTVSVTHQALVESDPTSLTTAILEKMAQELILDVFRPEITKIVVPARVNASQVLAAGRW
jgi:hypothetical protein